MNIKRFTFAICSLLTVLCFIGCGNDDLPSIDKRQLADHSVLVYIVADNNLSDSGDESFRIISKAYYNTPNRDDANLFVYLDNHEGDGLPVLYYLDPKTEPTVLKGYTEQNSVSPSVIREVCSTVFSTGQRAKSVNSVIFWSHGTNWYPANTKERTRSFGEDNNAKIDISDMADALKGLSINNLMFDACLMGSAEVAAEFADVADVLVASPTEILTTSYPYRTIIPALCTSKPDMHKVVDLYQQYYSSLSDIYQSGILTAVNLQGIRRLAETFGKLKNPAYGDGHMTTVPELCYDRERVHLFFDILQFAGRCRDKIAEESDAGTADVLYQDFVQAFRDCDIYTRHTDKFITINLKGACGLSVYIPGPAIVAGLDNFYKYLTWYQWSH